MKKILLFLLVCMASSHIPLQAKAQANEAAQLALNIEKLAQLKSILTTLKKGYQIVSTGYGAVSSLTKGNFSIHKIFLDGLMEVSPAVKKYRKVAGIIDYQITLVKEGKASIDFFRRSKQFNARDLDYMVTVCEDLIGSSVKNLDQLLNVVTANKLRMSDAERLSAIDQIYAEMEDKVGFLRYFKNSSALFGFQKKKELNDLDMVEIMNGVEKN